MRILNLLRVLNRLALPGWLVFSLVLVVCFILSPAWQSLPAKRLQLGTDLLLIAVGTAIVVDAIDGIF